MFPEKIESEKIIGLIKTPLPNLSTQFNLNIKVESNPLFISISDILSQEECNRIIEFCLSSPLAIMKENTIKETYGYSLSTQGIQRSSFYDINFANQLYSRLKPYLVEMETINNSQYRLIGLNPLIRFIFYKHLHSLIPHYDIPVEINENITTLKTIVLYLNDSNSGHTNFLQEIRTEHNYQDSEEHVHFPIIESVKPCQGKGIIFDHWKLHESAIIKEFDVKYILTTELAYIKE